ncbi:hypothetical protein PAPYR_12755 [Paratrimastix pyriformis]|uniref:Uncharacterized protein n=1 Tax=Paratrimastix pyriformis TaxID=342808 RepID=A0ABQ8U1C3_9EUKA|nr:hypothetical protein PAPYR_12755 [Paratrimastix pyriformis]
MFVGTKIHTGEIEFFEVVFRHHPKCFFDETHRFASSEPGIAMFVGTKIHTGDELDRLEPVPHPQEAIEYCEGAIGQDPPKWAEGYQAINCFRRRLSSLTQPLGAGLMTPHHLELIRQTFDGLFRPSSPDSAGKDLLLDIGGEEDEPEREEPSSPAPAATHTAPGAPPAPTPTAPKAPTALTARPTTPASGAVEHKDKGTGAARPILDDDDVPSPPKPKKAAPAAAKPKKDREAPEEGKKAAPVAAKSKKEAAKEAKAAAPAPPPPARRKPGPPHEAKEAAEAKGSDDAPRRTPGRGTGTSTRPQWRSPPRRRTRAAVPPNPRRRPSASGPGRPTRTTSPRRPLAKYCSPSLISSMRTLRATLPPPTPLAK